MRDLREIIAEFPGGEWQDALAAVIRQPEAERARARALLHDEIGPLLSSAGLQLKVLSFDLPAEVREQITEIQRLLDRAIDQAREVSRTLGSSASEGMGVRFALQGLAEKFSRESGRPIELEMPPRVGIPPAAARSLVQMFEECMTYTLIRGAGAIHVRVDQRALGWILEVLYHRLSPHIGEEHKGIDRFRLILFQYAAIRCEACVAMGGHSQAEQRIRVTYPGGAGAPDGGEFRPG